MKEIEDENEVKTISKKKMNRKKGIKTRKKERKKER